MVTTAREDLLAAGLAVFDRDGFEGATVAAIRTRARASNGSFFHFFGSKKELAGTLFLEILGRYHAAVLAAVDESCGARQGVARSDQGASGLGREQPARGALSVRDFAQRMDRRNPWRAARAEFAARRGGRALARAADRARRIAADDGDLVLQPDHRTCADFLSRLAVGPRPRRSQGPDRHPDRLRHPRGGCDGRGHTTGETA